MKDNDRNKELITIQEVHNKIGKHVHLNSSRITDRLSKIERADLHNKTEKEDLRKIEIKIQTDHLGRRGTDHHNLTEAHKDRKRKGSKILN